MKTITHVIGAFGLAASMAAPSFAQAPAPPAAAPQQDFSKIEI